VRIYQMTATFGKLEHQTLTLKPGLNVITAPNEWGKSTWCAFLVAMLYGIDTRSKSTKNILADKEHYAPWSGLPMEGRIDLNWNGRDITIERKTKKRIPMGEFLAYETESGIGIPELTAANCGQMLLGVEQSVFRRAGFIRHADLPVTQDEALRRRLNALVTTGDENNAADRLAATLKELRNKCRYNRTGLLPQTESERDSLEAKLTELDMLESQCKTHESRIAELKGWIYQLENHQQTLAYETYRRNARQADQARQELEEATRQLQEREAVCAQLPSQEAARSGISSLQQLAKKWSVLQQEKEQLPQEPMAPEAPAPFRDMTVENARRMIQQDTQVYVAAKHNSMAVILILVGLLGLAASGALVFLRSYLYAGIAGAGSLAALIWGIVEQVLMSRKVRNLRKKYGEKDQTRWPLPLNEYDKQTRRYQAAMKVYQEAWDAHQARKDALNQQLKAVCGNENPQTVMEDWNNAVAAWDACYAARREASRAGSHYESLQALVKPVPEPEREDMLTQPEEETRQLLVDCTGELQRLQNRMGQYQGRMEALGERGALQKQLKQAVKRIAKLESTYTALVIAQETLTQARDELQRRFAPKITKRAQQFMSAMTDGRYSSITMDTEFGLRTSTEEENTLRNALWRSDGTMDQLYLSLRLAVAEVLTPEAPLILDDALVRFDDERMKKTVAILEEMARQKQVILFSCQGREKQNEEIPLGKS